MSQLTLIFVMVSPVEEVVENTTLGCLLAHALAAGSVGLTGTLLLVKTFESGHETGALSKELVGGTVHHHVVCSEEAYPTAGASVGGVGNGLLSSHCDVCVLLMLGNRVDLGMCTMLDIED